MSKVQAFTVSPVERGATATRSIVGEGAAGAFGLGVDVGFVAPVETPIAPPPSVEPGARPDRYEPQTSIARQEVRADERSEIERQSDPFANLSREKTSMPERKLGAKTSGLERELDVAPKVLARMAAMAASPRGIDPQALRHVHLGAMLLASDAQNAKALPHDAKALERLASHLAAGKQVGKREAEVFWRGQARFLASSKANIQDYVQRVLRESYLIQASLLMDYAERVRALNERKRKLRDLATSARQTKASWTAQKGEAASDSFVAETPIDFVEIDDAGNVVVAAMTEEDVAAEQALDARSTNGASGDVQADYERVFGDSMLGATQRDQLDALKRDRGHAWYGDGLTDNYIRDHMDQLLAALPSMNKDDLKKYLVPILEHLAAGNPDEDEIVEIYGALSPVQLMYLWSGGVDPASLDPSVVESFRNGASYGVGVLNPVGLVGVSGALRTIYGSGTAIAQGVATAALDRLFSVSRESKDDIQLRVNVASRDVAGAVGAEVTGDVDKEEAAALLIALRAAAEGPANVAREKAETGSGGAGAPKRVRTLDQLDAYLKKLEEDLNSAGDDAQLANIDLQNALQKQQQLLQMMSNIAKVLHDTAMAIVRKTGA